MHRLRGPHAHMQPTRATCMPRRCWHGPQRQLFGWLWTCQPGCLRTHNLATVCNARAPRPWLRSAWRRFPWVRPHASALPSTLPAPPQCGCLALWPPHTPCCLRGLKGPPSGAVAPSFWRLCLGTLSSKRRRRSTVLPIRFSKPTWRPAARRRMPCGARRSRDLGCLPWWRCAALGCACCGHCVLAILTGAYHAASASRMCSTWAFQ